MKVGLFAEDHVKGALAVANAVVLALKDVHG